MMHRLYIFFLASMLSCVAKEVTTTQLLYLANHAKNPKMLVEGPYDKNEIIAYLKEWDGRGFEIIDGRYLSDKNLLLGNLGDTETIKKAYENYVSGENVHIRLKGFRSLVRIAHPEVLRVVGDDIYKPVSQAYVYHERGDFLEIPYSNAGIILSIVKDSGFFPVSAAEWSQNLRGDTQLKKLYEHLETIREFWTLNREAIMDRDYEKVVVPKNEDEKASNSLRQMSKKAVDGEVTKKEIVNIEYIEVTETDALEERDEESFQWWLWLIGLLVVVSGLGLVFRSKS